MILLSLMLYLISLAAFFYFKNKKMYKAASFCFFQVVGSFVLLMISFINQFT